MSRYTIVKLNISQGQIDKIKRAIQTGSQVSIRLSHSDLETFKVNMDGTPPPEA